jgi:hypothetical protein
MNPFSFGAGRACLAAALCAGLVAACDQGAAYKPGDAGADTKKEVGGEAPPSTDGTGQDTPADVPQSNEDVMPDAPGSTADTSPEVNGDTAPDATGDTSPDGPGSDHGAATDAACDSGTGGNPCVNRTLGQKCTMSTECASGACADGVCCTSSCATTCYSCLNVDTGKGDGTCALVVANTAHGNDCAATASTTCGTTGKCDGAGACLKWPGGTLCGPPQTCPAGAPSGTLSGGCNGSGACNAGATMPCGLYLCNGTTNTCRTTCTVDADCAANYFCIGSTCKKKPDGTICGGNAECASGTCGGRCCPSGTSCNCPQPSASNLLTNPGFDTTLSGWTTTVQAGGSSSIRTDPTDATSCPWSLSMYAYHWETEDNPTMSQCVPVVATKTYNFGGSMQTVNCINAWCDLHWYNGSSCGGVETGSTSEFTWNGSPWFTQNVGPISPPADAVSAKVVCANSPGYSADCWTNWDNLYLSAAPAQY